MFRSVRRRINVGFIVVTMLCILSITTLSIYQTKQIAEKQLKNDGVTIVSAVHTDINEYSINKDLDKITRELKDIKSKSNNSITYVSVIDNNCKIIAHEDDSMVGKSSDRSKFTKILDEGKIDGFMFIRPTGDTVYNVSMPIEENDKIVGAVSVGLSLDNMKEIEKKGYETSAMVSLVIIAISIAIGSMISSNISRPLKSIQNKMKRLADGDFTVKFHAKSNDEIGQLMTTLGFVVNQVREMMVRIKDTVESLDSMSSTLSSSSEEVAASGEEVTNSIMEVSSSATNQSNNIENMTESLGHFAMSLDIIDNKLKNVSERSGKIKNSADKGSLELEGLTTSIDEIRKGFSHTEKRIVALNENVSKISEITDVINAVAKKTNLLALNAAIEAARAGESGKGFSVVAEEIRKLAEQVLESSKSINSLISTVTSNTAKVSTMTKEVSNKMQNQVKSVNGTVESFKDILIQVESILPQVENVYEALNNSVDEKDKILEKSKLIEESSEVIAASSQEISSSIQEQSATTEELAASAQQLKNTADNLEASLEKFKV